MGLVKIKIQSVSDVITNSSSEVFLTKVTDNFKKVFTEEDHKYFDVIILNEEDLKKWICEKDHWELESLDELVDHNPLYHIYDTLEDCGKTIEEAFEFFKDCYTPLIGYAIFTCEDTYSWSKLENYHEEYRNKEGEDCCYSHT